MGGGWKSQLPGGYPLPPGGSAHGPRVGVNDGTGGVGEALNEPRGRRPPESCASGSGRFSRGPAVSVAPTPDQLCAAVHKPACSVGEGCVVRGSSGAPHSCGPLDFCSASTGACSAPAGAGSLTWQTRGRGDLGNKRQRQQAAGEPRYECLKERGALALQLVPQPAKQAPV